MTYSWLISYQLLCTFITNSSMTTFHDYCIGFAIKTNATLFLSYTNTHSRDRQFSFFNLVLSLWFIYINFKILTHKPFLFVSGKLFLLLFFSFYLNVLSFLRVSILSFIFFIYLRRIILLLREFKKVFLLNEFWWIL